jgi:hypothetical protein
MRELRLSIPFVGGATAVFTKEEVKQNLTTAKKHARMAFVFGPLVAAAYVCKYGAKAARVVEKTARCSAEKLEAADKSVMTKAQAVNDDILGLHHDQE